MYPWCDGGQVRIPNKGHTFLTDATSSIIVMAFIQAGIETTCSDGGHINTRDHIDPVEVFIRTTKIEADEIAKLIQEHVDNNQPESALERIEVVTWGKHMSRMYFFHTRNDLRSDVSDESTLSPFYVEGEQWNLDDPSLNSPNWDVEYERHVTPEVKLEWNRLTMVSQVAVAITLLHSQKVIVGSGMERAFQTGPTDEATRNAVMDEFLGDGLTSWWDEETDKFFTIIDEEEGIEERLKKIVGDNYHRREVGIG